MGEVSRPSPGLDYEGQEGWLIPAVMSSALLAGEQSEQVGRRRPYCGPPSQSNARCRSSAARVDYLYMKCPSTGSPASDCWLARCPHCYPGCARPCIAYVRTRKDQRWCSRRQEDRYRAPDCHRRGRHFRRVGYSEHPASPARASGAAWFDRLRFTTES